MCKVSNKEWQLKIHSVDDKLTKTESDGMDKLRLKPNSSECKTKREMPKRNAKITMEKTGQSDVTQKGGREGGRKGGRKEGMEGRTGRMEGRKMMQRNKSINRSSQSTEIETLVPR
jgi:hypothetical protein